MQQFCLADWLNMTAKSDQAIGPLQARDGTSSGSDADDKSANTNQEPCLSPSLVLVARV